LQRVATTWQQLQVTRYDQLFVTPTDLRYGAIPELEKKIDILSKEQQSKKQEVSNSDHLRTNSDKEDDTENKLLTEFVGPEQVCYFDISELTPIDRRSSI
jgi:hypothetical protein